MLNQTACTGAVLQMLSHGLMTALFFALIGMIYGRTHTRDIREMGGLMQIMPFLSVCYVIAGLASLGLPGLSGFVAEMTIFVGSFEHTDTFHRVLTIVACTSIVITAVYILRVVGKLLFGAVQNEHHRELTDAENSFMQKHNQTLERVGLVRDNGGEIVKKDAYEGQPRAFVKRGREYGC
jgi:NADH-quinone oxidoreductase subunit M